MVLGLVCYFFLAAYGGIPNGFPSINFSNKLGPIDGLKDRIVYQVQRNSNGLYLFGTDKIQLYTGERFVGEPISIDGIRLMNDHYILTEDYSILETNSFSEVNVNFPDLEIVHEFVDHNAIIFLMKDRDSNEYSIYEWYLNKFRLVKNFTTSEELKSFAILNEEIFIINAKNQIIHIKDGELMFDGNKLEDLSFPGLDYIKSAGAHIYFSFSRKQGIFKMDIGGEVEMISDTSVIYKIKKDDNGKSIIIGRNQVIVKNSFYLINEKDEIENWNKLLDINDIILDIYSDDFYDEIIVGSYSGIEILKFVNKKSFLQSRNAYKKKNKRGFGQLILSIAEDKWGNLLMFKENGQIFLDNNIEIEEITHDEIQFKGLLKVSLYDPVEDVFWLGCYDPNRVGYLYTLDVEDRIIKPQMEIQAAFATFVSKEGEKYFAGYNGSVYKIDGTEVKLFDLSEPFEGGELRSIFIKDEVVLLGNQSGLYKVDSDFNPNSVERIESVDPAAFVISIDKFEDRYYIGTYGKGLIILDEQFNLIKNVNENCCSINDYVYSTEFDSEKRIWMGTNNGLFVLDADANLADRFTVGDGISDLEFNREASLINSRNEMVFGTVNGITIANPNDYVENKLSEYYLRDVLSFNQSDVYYGKSNSFEYYFNTTSDSIQLTVEYCGFDDIQFTYGAKNNLKYEGDGELTIKKNTISIHSPGLGVHRLFINGMDAEPVEINVARNYPKLFRNVIFFMVLLGLFSFFAYNFIESRNKKLVEESEIQKQLAQIKLEALRSQLNPHFIFNSLAAIGYYVQANENKAASRYLTKFAKLIRAFLESSKNEYISIKDEISLLTYYLELEKMRFEENFNFEIECDANINKSQELIPTMLLQPFVENAIIHGIVNRKDQEGFLKISFAKSGNTINCSIDDNGVGRIKSEEIKSNSIKKHKSRSTEIINERLKASEDAEEGTITIDFVDKYEDGKAKGTTVLIDIINYE